MRIDKRKDFKKKFNLCATLLEVEEPLKIILDESFVSCCINFKIPIKDELSKLINRKLTIMTTNCIVTRAPKINQETSYGIKKMIRYKCPHNKEKDLNTSVNNFLKQTYQNNYTSKNSFFANGLAPTHNFDNLYNFKDPFLKQIKGNVIKNEPNEETNEKKNRMRRKRKKKKKKNESEQGGDQVKSEKEKQMLGEEKHKVMEQTDLENELKGKEEDRKKEKTGEKKKKKRKQIDEGGITEVTKETEEVSENGEQKKSKKSEEKNNIEKGIVNASVVKTLLKTGENKNTKNLRESEKSEKNCETKGEEKKIQNKENNSEEHICIENKGVENKDVEKKDVENKDVEKKGVENKDVENKDVEKKGVENKIQLSASAKCIIDLVKNNNEKKFFIGTNNLELRSVLRRIFLVPIIYINECGTLKMEHLSTRNENKKVVVERRRMKIPQWERNLRKLHRQKEENEEQNSTSKKQNTAKKTLKDMQKKNKKRNKKKRNGLKQKQNTCTISAQNG